MNPIKFPEMVVEKRPSKTSHGLKERHELKFSEAEQMQDMLEMVEFAKTGEERLAELGQQFIDANIELGFPNELLDKYSPFSSADYAAVMAEFGFFSWNQVTDFVRADECVEIMVIVSKWAKEKKLKPKVNRGFIDGSGFGIYREYDRVAKPIMERCFDAKWFFQALRPLEMLRETLGYVCRNFFNYMHPGHPEYPTGHGAKFAAARVTAEKLWHLDGQESKALAIFCYVLSMGRSGGGVHLPDSNNASFYLAKLPEYDRFAK